MFFLLTYTVFAQSDPQRDKILQQAVNGWKTIENTYKYSSFKLEQQRDDLKHDPVKRDYNHSWTEVSWNGVNALSLIHLDNNDGSEMQNLYGQNKKYRFRLERSKQSDPWFMNDLIFRSRITEEFPSDISARDTIMSPWSILGIPLTEIFHDRSIKNIKMTDVSLNTEDPAVTISFELASNSNNELLTQLRSATIKLSPFRNYAITEFIATFAAIDGNSFFQGIGQCEYQETPSSPPILKSYSYTLVRELGKKKKITWKTQISNMIPCGLSEKDFTLSAYGFSEPAGPNRSLYILRALLFILGTALLGSGIAFGVNWVKQRIKRIKSSELNL